MSTLLHLVFPSSCAATKTSAMSKILQNLNSNKCKSWNMLLLGYSHGYWQPKFGIFMSTEKSHNASTWLYSNDFPHWQQQQQQQQQQQSVRRFKQTCRNLSSPHSSPSLSEPSSLTTQLNPSPPPTPRSSPRVLQMASLDRWLRFDSSLTTKLTSNPLED